MTVDEQLAAILAPLIDDIDSEPYPDVAIPSDPFATA